MNNLTDPQYIKDLMRHYNVKPKDYLGQNFLVDEIALDAIVDAGEVKNTDTVVEVGPGLGILTEQLAKRAKRLVAIEKDKTLIDILKFNIKDFKNIELHNQDVLKFDLSKEVTGPYKVIANIPYYLTSFLFQYMLSQKNRPEMMVLLVQKEVGQRVTAKPGDLSILGISVQLFADAEIVCDVPKYSFWPTPKVDSVVLKLIPHNKYPQVKDEKEFFRIVKVAFAAKRKQLHNNFANGFKMSGEEVDAWLQKNKIDPKSRAEDLSVQDWINLYTSKPF